MPALSGHLYFTNYPTLVDLYELHLFAQLTLHYFHKVSSCFVVFTKADIAAIACYMCFHYASIQVKYSYGNFLVIVSCYKQCKVITGWVRHWFGIQCSCCKCYRNIFISSAWLARCCVPVITPPRFLPVPPKVQTFVEFCLPDPPVR